MSGHERSGSEAGGANAAGEPSAPGLRVGAFRTWLATQDRAELSDDDRLDLLTELELLNRAVGGVSVRTQVSFHASQVAAQVEAGVAPSRAGRAVPDDLAQARRTSPYWGSRELTSAKALVTEMPCTLAALDRGDISLYQSRLITESTALLDPADRAEVDRRLEDSLPGASTAEIGATVRGLVYEVDPKGYVDRARKAAKDRGVSIRPCPDVMALLSARLPAAQAIACHTALKEKAISMRASGDPRSIAQLMADILFERLTGRSVVDGVDVEVGVVMTDSALFDGTSESADLVGYGPIPAEMARDLLRPHCPTEDRDTDGAADAHAGAHTDTDTDTDEGGGPTPGAPADQPCDDPPDEPCEDPPDEPCEDPADEACTDAADAVCDDPAAGAPGAGVCPDGIRCTSWSCSRLHGSPEALAPAQAPDPLPPRRPPAPPAPAPRSSAPPDAGPSPAPDGQRSAPDGQRSAPDGQRSAPAATKAAQVWLRRLWTDPATGALTGRDTRRRLFTGSLRAALIARDRTCRNTWCGAPVRAIDHKVRARDGGPTSDTNGQGLCQRCNNAREHPRARPLGAEDYRPPPPLLPTFLTDRAPPWAA